MKMLDGPDVRETQSELCRSPSTMCSLRTGSCFKSKSEYVTEELGMCCCNKEKRTKIHVKNVMMMVLRGPKSENDSVKAIGSKEVGRAVEESNAMDSIRVVEFDPRVLREPRQMEIDFVNQLDVHRQRPRQWASSIPVIPTKWLDVNGGGAKQLEYCSRLCEKELNRLSSKVKCATFDMMSRSVVSATSDVVSEPPTDEQVVCQDLHGKLSCSLSGKRTEVCIWEKKLQEVLDCNTLLLATTYQSRSCCRERELCGFVHDHFITEGDSVQLTWIESRLKERLNFERCA